jgi:hypothetical protein
MESLIADSHLEDGPSARIGNPQLVVVWIRWSTVVVPCYVVWATELERIQPAHVPHESQRVVTEIVAELNDSLVLAVGYEDATLAVHVNPTRVAELPVSAATAPKRVYGVTTGYPVADAIPVIVYDELHGTVGFLSPTPTRALSRMGK